MYSWIPSSLSPGASCKTQRKTVEVAGNPRSILQSSMQDSWDLEALQAQPKPPVPCKLDSPLHVAPHGLHVACTPLLPH